MPKRAFNNLFVNTMPTVHIMGLQAEPFEKIRSGKKTIELRLFDEKRKTIQLGDVIEFQKQPEKQETIRTEVIALLRYGTFSEFFDDFPIENFGGTDKAAFLESIHRFYTPEQEQKETVLGIKLNHSGLKPRRLEKTWNVNSRLESSRNHRLCHDARCSP